MDSMETKKKLTTILIHVILIIVSITMLVPFIWMILTAFKTVTEATSVDPFTIFPKIWRKDAFISVDLAKNILVIKTVSGMAMAAAAAFDEMNWNEIVGCIGGDDTILCVARDDDAALVAAERLKKMVDGMEETGEEF